VRIVPLPRRFGRILLRIRTDLGEQSIVDRISNVCHEF
jgi:hypothetical protein